VSLRRSAALARHEFRVLRTDPSTPIFLILMPLLMMAFMKPLFRLALVGEGVAGANGSEQAVPGLAVMFAAFFVGFIGFSFFRDHGWGMWERLRASSASSFEIMIGKVLPPLAVSLAQIATLFIVGGLIFDLRIRGSIAAVAVVCVALSVCLLAFGIAMTAVTRTAQQLNALGSLGGFIFAALGGSLVPIAVMPAWAQHAGPATPTYWAMRGFRSVIIGGGGMGDVLLPAVVLAGFTVLFVAVAALKFRFEESKVYWG
jgi:ABC-2 type transport system permease protein